jgi:two-component system, OmpR family, phosphate regulon response regulator PhoB
MLAVMSELVLIVEDDPDLRGVMEYAIQAVGYRTVALAHASRVMPVAREASPGLILLDLMLPDGSGTELVKELKRDPRTKGIPVVMVTARGEEIDRVVGFELGADDYVVKPFSIRELLLRVSKVLRRTAEPAVAAERVGHGPIVLELASRRAFALGNEVALTAIEFDLLRTLIERRGRVQTRARLYTDVWNVSPDLESRTVDTTVKRLRQKLGSAGAYIETVRGVGYLFADAPLTENPDASR